MPAAARLRGQAKYIRFIAKTKRWQARPYCEIAREREQRYTVSRRLFRTNAAGEREYLDDAAVAEARAKAAADVKDWCG